jgi:hypothetical protein
MCSRRSWLVCGVRGLRWTGRSLLCRRWWLRFGPVALVLGARRTGGGNQESEQSEAADSRHDGPRLSTLERRSIAVRYNSLCDILAWNEKT